MAGVGLVLLWLGYSVFYYGLDTVTGGNDSFASLVIPGRYKATPRDGASTPPGAGVSAGGPSTGGAVPTASNPGGISVWSPTTAPKGAPPQSHYRVNQDGVIQQQQANGSWKVYSLPGSGVQYQL